MIGQIDKKYISSIDFLDAREILNQALDIQNEDYSFLDVMELTNRSVVTSEPQYHHFVNEELYKLGVVQSTSGTGTTITVTLTSDTSDAAKAGDIVMFNDGKQGYVQSKSGAALTVISVDGTAINTSVANADNLSFFTYAAAEGSGAPDPERWGLTKYANQVQIYKAKWQVTDIQKVSAIEVQYNGKNYIMYKGQHDVLRKFRANISFSMLLSIASAANFQAQSASITDANGKPVQTTKGLNQYVEDDGIIQPLIGSTIALQDLEDLNTTLNLARCPKDYELYVGTVMNMQFDNYLNSLGNGTILSQAARYQITQNLDLGVDSFKLYGRTYHKIYMPMLDHRAVTNYTGAPDYYKSAYLVPMGKIKVDDGQDMIDRMRVRYMNGDGTDLRYREIVTGALAPTPTNEDSLLAVSYTSVQGLEILGAQHFAKLTPAQST